MLIANGQIKEYYEKDISSKEYEELDKKYPGMYFAPRRDCSIMLILLMKVLKIKRIY